ncbi:histone arginine methyltransferase CARMER [Echinococcus multilocularis]|uniref:type I protein arginine methyltransferase n=1 Tax=Echinococcus multilocularis TaxID=6211 RepID=A0A068XXP5_ECHMU|nr:histone arginine methyltransferase CARMER [Echinococcus multilocularis]
MVFRFKNVDLRKLTAGAFHCELIERELCLAVQSLHETVLSFVKNEQIILELNVKPSQCIRCLGKSVFIDVNDPNTLYLVSFSDSVEISRFMDTISDNNTKELSKCGHGSVFDERTDSWSAVQYFQFYSYLSQQQNMMQDYIRTSTYQRAILANSKADFVGKVVLDVGAGSGILSFFAVQAGAKRVYAVEASNMAEHCQVLVKANKLAGRIVVVSGKIEDITLPEPVDVIVSEPMGYMLYNERMLETYVHARKFLAFQHRAKRKRDAGENGSSDSEMGDAFVNKNYQNWDREVFAEPKPGVMFPSVGKMFVAPFSDEALFAELYTKANFWYQQSFHGMDLSALRGAAIKEYFNQPVVDTFDISICPVTEPCVHNVDFRTVSESDLANIEIPLVFHISQCSTIHGLAFWFDVGFLGSQTDVWLSTAPTEPLTHWYQVRCLLGTALFVQEGQILTGHVKMVANTRQSYDVEIELVVPDSDTKITNHLDLKNPHFRYTGYPPAPPPGSHTKSPTEMYFANVVGSTTAVVGSQTQPTVIAADPGSTSRGAFVATNTAAVGGPGATLLFPSSAAAATAVPDQTIGVGGGMVAAATVLPQSPCGAVAGLVNAAPIGAGEVFPNGCWALGGQAHLLPSASTLQAGHFQISTPTGSNTVLYDPRTPVP